MPERPNPDADRCPTIPFEVFRVETYSVVLKNQRQPFRFLLEHNANLAGLRMLQNVVQSFLNQPVQHRRHIGGQRIVSPERLNIDTNAIALLPLRNVGFDRFENSEVVDRRRPQVRSRAMNITAYLCSELFQPSYLLGCRLSVASFGQSLLECLEAERQPCHRLADLVVQFPRYPALLLFLGGSQPSKQMRPLRLCALENIDVGQHAVNHMAMIGPPFRSPCRAQPIFPAVVGLNLKCDAA